MSDNNEYIPEKNIKGQQEAIPLNKILKIGQKKVCKIKCSNNGTGSGFFCNIIDEWNPLRALVTNRHVLNEEDLKPGKKISFSKNDDEDQYVLEIDEERKVFTSKKYDVTIVEIRKEDNIKPDSFFDIDENVYDPNYNFKDKLIILLHYPKGDEMSLSTGSIKQVGVDEKNYEIYHLCSSDRGSSGGPLINIKDYKVLAIHKGASKEFNDNFDTLLKEPIIEFKNQMQNLDNKSSYRY